LQLREGDDKPGRFYTGRVVRGSVSEKAERGGAAPALPYLRRAFV